MQKIKNIISDYRFRWLVCLMVACFVSGGTALAAPNYIYQQTILPTQTDTYDLGTTTKEWNNIYVNNLHCTGTGCSGGSGEINTGGNLGMGHNIYDSKSGVKLQFNSIAAGANITVSTSSDPNTLVISSTGGSGGSGTVSTSTHETSGSLAYWTSNSATPALLGQVATGTISNGAGISVTAGQSVIGTGLTITNTGVTSNVAGTGISLSGGTGAVTVTNTGVISNSCPGGFLTCSGTNPSSFTLGTLGVNNGGTGSTTLTGILKGNGTSQVGTAVGGTDYEFPLTFSSGLNRTGNAITNTGVTSIVAGTNISISGATGAVTINSTGGGGTGLSTSSPVSASNLLVYSSVGAGSAYGVATSTLTASTPLTGSFTQIGSGGSLGCQTASGSQAGCLSSADWTTFNNKGSGTVTSIATNNGLTGGTITTTGTIGLAAIAANSLLGNNTGGSAVPSAIATSSLGLTVSSFASSNISQWTNNSGYLTAAITALGPTGQTQTGATQTLASSTGSFNGLTAGITIVGSGNTQTFTPSITGTLNNAGLTNSTISGIALGGTLGALTATNSTLTFSGSYTGAAAQTVGLNLANSNTWTGQQIFNTTAPKFGTITGSTQCLHVDTTGLVSGTGSDCGAGGSNFLTNVSANTFLNKGTNLQAPVLMATSTIATSTFAGDVAIGSSSELPNPYLFIGTSTSFLPIFGRVPGDLIDAEDDFNGVSSLNVVNGTIGSCAASTFFADGNNPTLGGYAGTFSWLNDGWTDGGGAGCGNFASTLDKPEAVVLANPTGEMDFDIASTTQTGATDFNFNVNNVNKLKLTNSGNLGLATTTPSATFSIQANIAPVNNSYFDLGSSTGQDLSRWTSSAKNVWGFGTSTPTSALSVVAASTTLGTVETAYNGQVSIIAGFENATLKIFQTIDQWGHRITGGDAPVLSSCGTTPSFVGAANDNDMSIQVGSVSATGCTATFAHAWPAAPTCTVTERTGSVTNAFSYTLSTTAVVVTQTALTSDILDIRCEGTQ